jgi:hypothetical protein
LTKDEDVVETVLKKLEVSGMLEQSFLERIAVDGMGPNSC